MPSTTELIKELREKTGAGIMECKRAVEDAVGDLVQAEKLLKERGLALAANKAGREAGQGLIEGDVPLLDQPYIRDGSKTVQELLNETIAKVRENVVIRRFARFELGGQ